MRIRKKILNDAESIVCSDREAQYGAPEDNFRLIGELWGIYLGGAPFPPKDVAIMLALLKVARIRTGKHKLDNYIDLAGYAACAGEIADNEPVPVGSPGVLLEDALSADEYREYVRAQERATGGTHGY